jgi:uncharacterized membrane protein
MTTARLAAFSDGVIAILITILVLEFHAPRGDDWAALRPLVPTFLAYVLSFVFLGIYWNNHHHMLHLTHKVTGAILWANLHLLFWLSLVPFVTGWMGQSHLAPLPTAAYGAVLLLSGIAYLILQGTIIRSQGEGSKLAAAVGSDVKGKASALCYASAIGLAFVRPWISAALFASVALIWLVPDSRIESRLENEKPAQRD